MQLIKRYIAYPLEVLPPRRVVSRVLYAKRDYIKTLLGNRLEEEQ